jgi:uncharacterized protein (TIGR02246 family)
MSASACSSGIVTPGVSPGLKHSWEVCFNKGDVMGVLSLYAEDAQLVMSGSNPAHGRAAIRAAVEAMIKSGVKVRINADRNVGSGEIAYVYGHYIVLERDGGKSVEAGSYIELWRRHGERWLIDLDVNAAGPAMQSE